MNDECGLKFIIHHFAFIIYSNVSLQLILLGMLFNTSGTIVNVLVALAASHTGDRFKARIQNSGFFRWLTGGVFIGLGLRLALLERK